MSHCRLLTALDGFMENQASIKKEIAEKQMVMNLTAVAQDTSVESSNRLEREQVLAENLFRDKMQASSTKIGDILAKTRDAVKSCKKSIFSIQVSTSSKHFFVKFRFCY